MPTILLPASGGADRLGLRRAWDRLSAKQQQTIQQVLLAAGVLSIAIPLSSELVGFLVRLRRQQRQGVCVCVCDACHPRSPWSGASKPTHTRLSLPLGAGPSREPPRLLVDPPISISLPSPIHAEHERGKRRPRVFRVVLTGGPCSGKTSSLEHLKRACRDRGYEWCVALDASVSGRLGRGAGF
jgi:hypothetical protein